VSSAIEAERLLTGAGFSVRIMPTPVAIEAGCGFCIRVSPDSAEEVCDWMREQGAPHAGFYARDESAGGDEYISLETGGKS